MIHVKSGVMVSQQQHRKKHIVMVKSNHVIPEAKTQGFQAAIGKF